MFFFLLHRVLNSKMTLTTNTQQAKIVDYGSFQRATSVEKTQFKHLIKWLVGLQIFTIVVTVLLIGTFYLVAYPNSKDKRHHFTDIGPSNSVQNDNINILYAIDPVGHSFCFQDGKYGETITDWTVYNRCSDIDFNAYYNGGFSVGIEGGRVGTIIDLGSRGDLQKKYKYQETVGDGQGYASIHRTNKTLLILKDSHTNRTYQTMDESAALFGETTSSSNVAVKLGHVYALRIVDRFDHAFERVVKMLVIAYQPNESVTIRWEVLI